jgi:hypothetical protein
VLECDVAMSEFGTSRHSAVLQNSLAARDNGVPFYVALP